MSNNDIHNYNLERVYKIRHQPPEVFTPGCNAEGEQILVGQLNNELLVAIFFTPDGTYTRYQLYPIIRVPDPNLPETVTRQQSRIIQEALGNYIRSLGMTPCDIQISHFAFPGWDIGIAEWYLSDFPAFQRSVATGTPLENERLIQWQQDKKWILHWGNEFEMSNDGEVLSS
jgi:hypothetical protein